MKYIKIIISYIMAFVLTIGILLTILLTIADTTILSEKNIKAKMQEQDYYTQTYNIIINECNNYVLQAGLDETIFDEVITKEQVTEEINQVVHYIYTGTEYTVDTAKIETKLQEKINKVAEQKNIKMDKETTNAVKEFIKTIKETYQNSINYSAPIVKQIEQRLEGRSTITKIAIGVLIIVNVIIAIVTYLLKEESVGIALLAAGIILILTKISAQISVAIKNVLILNQAFSNVLISICNQILAQCLIWGIALTITGIAWIVISQKIKFKQKCKEIK